jgi:hypothetical protein
MNTKTKIGIILAVLLVALGAIRMGLFSKGPTDQEAIKSALEDAVTAAKEGRPGPVLEFVSEQIAYNGDRNFTKALIAKFVKENQPEVDFDSVNPEIAGDAATMTTQVHVKLSGLGGISFEHQYKDVTLKFRREDTVQWLIFPGKTWRLSEVSAPGAPSAGSGGS